MKNLIAVAIVVAFVSISAATADGDNKSRVLAELDEYVNGEVAVW